MNKHTLNKTGVELKNRGQLAEAEACYRRAIGLDSRFLEAIGNLGVVLRMQGRSGEAVECFVELVKRCPALAQGYFSLGNALGDVGRLDEAIAAYRKALALDGGHLESRVNLGIALMSQEKFDAAVESFRHAIRQQANFSLAHRFLGQAEEQRGCLSAAIAAYREALRLNAADALTHAALGNVLKDIGESSAALSHYAQALQLSPADASFFDAYLMCLTYAGVPPAQWFAAHQAYGARFGHTASAAATPQDVSPNRKLKIGYVSGDFSQHAVANFIWPVIKAHDRSSFEITCYYNGPAEDRATTIFAKVADRWRHTAGLQSDALVSLIRNDAIDILVDLATHTAHNRLDVFARRAAPLQFTWMGYAATTGLSQIDYRISDVFLDPPGLTEQFHSEQLARTPSYSMCFEPSPVCPDIGPLPATRNGYITFASFNNSAKLNSRTLDLWAKLLRAVPESRLMLYMRGSDEPTIADHARKLFVSRGVAAERISPFGRQSFIDYLRLHDEADIALDPIGFSGVTTSCYALWMGVPAITLPEALPITRGAAAISELLGLDSFISKDEADYVRRAVSATKDLRCLADLREGLRARMKASSLMDPQRFTRELEALFRRTWQEFVERTAQDNKAATVRRMTES